MTLNEIGVYAEILCSHDVSVKICKKCTEAMITQLVSQLYSKEDYAWKKEQTRTYKKSVRIAENNYKE